MFCLCKREYNEGLSINLNQGGCANRKAFRLTLSLGHGRALNPFQLLIYLFVKSLDSASKTLFQEDTVEAFIRHREA